MFKKHFIDFFTCDTEVKANEFFYLLVFLQN